MLRLSIGAGAALLFGFSVAAAEPNAMIDPVAGFGPLFGLGGHACKQYDDRGRLYLYTEGLPSAAVMDWLQRSEGGMKANVPIPLELQAALATMPGCLPGKHHAGAPA